MSCQVCGGETRTVLGLGSSPPTCNMLRERAPERHYPLEVLFCDGCGLAQLSVAVPAEEMFPPDYPYSSGNSKGLHDNFADLASKMAPVLRPDDLVVDIGANDGTLLSKFKGHRTVGVEPTAQAERIEGPSYQEFFSEGLAEEIVKAHGPAKVVTACNVLAHVEDIHATMRGIKTLLGEDGVLVAENHDLEHVVDGQWDTIYHEHLRFYSPSSFAYLLGAHGLGVQDWQRIPTHGGSFRTFAKLGEGIHPERVEYDFERLAWSASVARRALRGEAKGVWGIGATARATTVINYCGLDVEDLECVCEVSGSDKIGYFIPGTRIPVVDEKALFEQQPETAILFSWHLADFIVPKLRKGYHGTLLAPLPYLRKL